MLGIGVNFGLHAHELREDLRVSAGFEMAVLSNSRDHILVNSSS